MYAYSSQEFRRIWEEMDTCVLEWVPLLDELSTEAEHWYYNEDWKREWFEKTDGYMRKDGNKIIR